MLFRSVVQLPGVQDTARAKDIIGRAATLELRMVDDTAEAKSALLGGVIVADAIAGRANRWAGLYDPRRVTLRAAAELERTKIVLCGILPTLDKPHLGLESMTPIPRYKQLNDIMVGQRGGHFKAMIKGLDELIAYAQRRQHIADRYNDDWQRAEATWVAELNAAAARRMRVRSAYGGDPFYEDRFAIHGFPSVPPYPASHEIGRAHV